METVLIIEDSRPMQRTLQRLFEADSLGVRIASDGEAGIEIFRHEPPNVVVLDLKLPGLSGKELCRSFKTEMPSVPIVVVSASVDVDDKVVAARTGCGRLCHQAIQSQGIARSRAARFAPNFGKASRGNGEAVSPHEMMSFGDVKIDCTSMEAHRSGIPVALTAQEFKLLKFLALRRTASFPGRNCSTKSGDTRTIPRRARWIITSSGFARSSNPILRTLAFFLPFMAPVTSLCLGGWNKKARYDYCGEFMSRLRLQTQLLVSALLILCSLTGSLLLVIRYTIRAQIAEQVQNGTDASVQEFGPVQRQFQFQLSRTASLLAEIPTLKALMTTRDAPTIQDASTPFWQLSGGDLFLLADPQGRVVSLHRRIPAEQAVAEQRIAEASQNGKGIGLVVFGRATALGFSPADPGGIRKRCQVPRDTRHRL